MFCCGIPVGRSARAAITHDHHAHALDGTVVYLSSPLLNVASDVS